MCILISTNLQAQTTLFTGVQTTPLPSPLPFINSIQSVTLNFDGLKAFPDQLRLNFPDGTFTIINKQRFDPRRGYIFRDEDEDPPGTPDFWIDPDASQSEFSFLWAGSNDDYDLVITSYLGLVSATISGNTKRYVLKQNGPNSQLIDVYLPGLPSNANDTINGFQVTNKIETPNQDLSQVSHLKSFTVDSYKAHENNRLIATNIVDILIVYNDAARIEAGGSNKDPDDTLAIEQQITAEIDNLNTALSNSESNTRVTKFHVAKLSDFSHGFDAQAGLNKIRTSVSVKNLRNQVGADSVIGILETNRNNFSACGYSYGHTAETNGTWTIGPGFSEHSYSIVAEECILYDFTFTHEFGHQLGANHARDEPDTSLVPGIIANGYPDAFAWRDGGLTNSSIKTVLSIAHLTTARRLYFSNPNVSIGKIPIGNINTENNTRVIDHLAQFTANYRERADLIFINGFE